MTVWKHDGEQATYAERRGALKAHILESLGITAEQEIWESWWEAAEELELSEAALESVANEVSDELRRRAGRLPYIKISAVLP